MEAQMEKKLEDEAEAAILKRVAGFRDLKEPLYFLG